MPQSFIIFFLPGMMLVNAAIVKSHATGMVSSNSELSLQGCATRPHVTCVPLPPLCSSLCALRVRSSAMGSCNEVSAPCMDDCATFRNGALQVLPPLAVQL